MIVAKLASGRFRSGRFSSALCALALSGLPFTTANCAPTAPATKAAAPALVLRWTPSPTNALGEAKPEVLGAPRPLDDALSFDGAHDALIFPVNPLENLSRFTVQLLFRPDVDGAPEQRVFHMQDKLGRRVLLEIRLDPATGNWSLDTFLHADPETKLTLLERGKQHPAGKWTWVTLTYDGKIMRHFVGTTQEAQGQVAFPAMTAGEASLGVRLNRVNWFKGSIREIRIYDSAAGPVAE